MSNSPPLEQLEQTLERAIENVRQVGHQTRLELELDGVYNVPCPSPISHARFEKVTKK